MGFLMGLPLYGLCLLFAKTLSDYETVTLFFAFCPILAFFEAYSLNLDMWPTVFVYIGTSLAFVPFSNLSLAGICFYGVFAAVIAAVLGRFSYLGRADGWDGWWLRVFALSPTFIITLFMWEIFAIVGKLIVLALAIIIHYWKRNKLAFRSRNLIFLAIYTFLSATVFFELWIYLVFLLLNPDYYP